MKIAKVLPHEAAIHLAKAAEVGASGSKERSIAVNAAINWVRWRYEAYFRREPSESKTDERRC